MTNFTPYYVTDVVTKNVSDESSETSQTKKFVDAEKDITTTTSERAEVTSNHGGFLSKLKLSYQTWYSRERSREELKKRKICWGIFLFVLICTGIGVLIASLGKVNDQSYGIEYNVHSKQLDDAVRSGELCFGPPGFEFIKFPRSFITVDLNERTCVSYDGLLVVVSVTFQYRMMEENVLDVILKYRNFDRWADVVEAAGLSAIHHSCGNYVISDFQNKRGEIQLDMEENLRLKLEGDPNDTNGSPDGVYAKVESVQLQNIELPVEYNDAVQEKQSAEEDISLAENERKQEITKAETERLRAEEEARKILDTARNEADLLLTEARLKAEGTMFSFEKEAETILEVKASLNLTTEGVLAYLYNTLLSEVTNLRITTGEPAKLSRKEEL